MSFFTPPPTQQVIWTVCDICWCIVDEAFQERHLGWHSVPPIKSDQE